MSDDATRTLNETRHDVDAEGVVDALILARTPDGRAPSILPLAGPGLELGRAMGTTGGALVDPGMSRRHAALRRERGRWVLQDLESRNGVYLDGERIQQSRTLTLGSVIRTGKTVWVLGRVPSTPDVPDGIVGVSEAISAARRQARLAAPQTAAVLLLGATGTGKEVFAQAIHRWSGRSGASVALNCASLAKGLMESELYGHRAGAFTGAARDKTGLFARASGGTLLLDELGEMPLDMQAGLLRALETGEIRPVGAAEAHAVNTRIVAATNADVVDAVRQGRFRADLYARLAQWVVHLPTLGERREDIPFLVEALLAREGVVARPSSALMEALLLHPWPLNVRGLVNVLRAACMSASGDDLPLSREVQQMLMNQRALMPTPEPAVRGAGSAVALPDDATIVEALNNHKGSVAAAARALGCSRQQLYRRVKALALDLDSIRRG